MDILLYTPGQQVTIYLEVLDSNGVRTDSYTQPAVDRVILPTFTTSLGYPQNMIKLDTGLYYHQFVLPSGATAIGSYLVDVSFTNPINSQLNSKLYQIIVTAPFGIYSTVTV
jgi:hypothetical protein